MDELDVLAQALRERLTQMVEMNEAIPQYLREPMADTEIEEYRRLFGQRHLSGELEEFMRLGPAWPVTPMRPEIYFEDLDDSQIELAKQKPLSMHSLVYSPRFLAAGVEETLFIATTPYPTRSSAVMLCDLGAPGHVWPVFPSLRSLLWFFNEVAQRLIDGELVDERTWMRSWFWDLLFPEEASSPVYRELRDEAVRLETDRHPGWLWDQPPVWDAGWTLEWMTAMGVGDADIENA